MLPKQPIRLYSNKLIVMSLLKKLKHLPIWLLFLVALQLATGYSFAAEISLTANTITENQAIGTSVGELLAAGSTSGTVTYKITDTEYLEFFAIENNILKSAFVFNYEKKEQYIFAVSASDDAGVFANGVLTVNILPTNDAPSAIVLSDYFFYENTSINSPIALISAQDEDETVDFGFELVAGNGDTDNLSFSITDKLLVVQKIFDHETQKTLSVRLKVTDSEGAALEQIIILTVANINEAPNSFTLQNKLILENAKIGDFVSKCTGQDPENGILEYRLVSGEGSTGNGAFSINTDQLVTAIKFDYEVRNEYQIRIRVTDEDGLFTDFNEIISIVYHNESPTNIVLSNILIAENLPEGSPVGSFATIDDDFGAFEYLLVAGDGSTDNDKFVIDNNLLKTKLAFDFELASSYHIRVQSTDKGGLVYQKTFKISVTDQNDPPTNIILNQPLLMENMPAGTLVTVLVTEDQDIDDTFAYSLVLGEGDDDNIYFFVESNELRSVAQVDYESGENLAIRIRVSDAHGETLEQPFEIQIGNMNEAPTMLSSDILTLPEGAEIGAEIGTFVVTDPDINDRFTIELVTGNGDEDNSSFSFKGNVLVSDDVFDYESKNTLSIRVRSSDAGGLFIENSFTVLITDEFETSISWVNKAERVQLYPNPVRDVLYLRANTAIIPNSITVTDATGKEIKLLVKNKFTKNGTLLLDTSGLLAGIYFLRVRNDKQTFVKPFFKK